MNLCFTITGPSDLPRSCHSCVCPLPLRLAPVALPVRPAAVRMHHADRARALAAASLSRSPPIPPGSVRPSPCAAGVGLRPGDARLFLGFEPTTAGTERSPSTSICRDAAPSTRRCRPDGCGVRRRDRARGSRAVSCVAGEHPPIAGEWRRRGRPCRSRFPRGAHQRGAADRWRPGCGRLRRYYVRLTRRDLLALAGEPAEALRDALVPCAPSP